MRAVSDLSRGAATAPSGLSGSSLDISVLACEIRLA